MKQQTEISSETAASTASASKRSIIIDTDPGQDDAFAIILALAHHERLHVLGITAVAGNIAVDHTAANAQKILKLAKREDIPVFKGAPAPLVAQPIFAEAIHGDGIMQGWDLAPSSTPLGSSFAPDWIIEMLDAEAPGSVTICALGPLTNIALVLAKRPDLASRIAQVVLMGGSQTAGGNMSAVAEFNIFADPHAADRVFGSPVPKVVVSLDITTKLLVDLNWIEEVAAIGGQVSWQLLGLLEFYAGYARADKPRPLHDPAVIAWLLQPDLFKGERWNVAVETGTGLCYGQTVVDRNEVTGRPANVHWLTDVDAAGFYRLVLEALRSMG
ncbi:nucleoside hydrolase [Tianweitania sp.]|uniref:nucleoside hydrolase n=1 Tax=Tianweitania sp. TaxID=2021634 RepID=UPI002897E064|nr:nucleoside hydrolase [Tianweitania sp.]